MMTSLTMTMMMIKTILKKGNYFKFDLPRNNEANYRQGLAIAGLGIGLLLMAFSAAFTGALLAPVISMGVSRIIGADIRFPQFPKDVFDEDEESKFEEEIVIDAKTKKTSKDSYEPYKSVKVSFDRLSDYNRRNNKFQEFSTTEDSLNIYEY